MNNMLIDMQKEAFVDFFRMRDAGKIFKINIPDHRLTAEEFSVALQQAKDKYCKSRNK